MGPPISNPFTAEEAVEAYRRGRPDHHGRAMAAVRELIGESPRGCGLDVGCGTGLSTAALGSLCDVVIGLDSAPAMVAAAAHDTGRACVVSLAEATPFPPESFDVLTASSALHWLDQRRFFAECGRVLRAGGWLALYDHFFIGIEGQPAFDDWLRDVYVERYPIPFHPGGHFGPDSDVPEGFRRHGHRDYDDPRAMTRSDIVEYHLAQSFVLAALAERGEPLDAARTWLDHELRQFVTDDEEATVTFLGTVAVLSRTSP